MHDGKGHIAFRGSRLGFWSEEYGNWSLPVDQIAVIAEFTNEEGPHLEDHYWALARQDGQQHYAPMSASGILEVDSELAHLLHCELPFNLFYSTSYYARRVMWPPLLAGRPLFTLQDVPRAWWDRVLRFWMPDMARAELTDEVRAFLAAEGGRVGSLTDGGGHGR